MQKEAGDFRDGHRDDAPGRLPASLRVFWFFFFHKLQAPPASEEEDSLTLGHGNADWSLGDCLLGRTEPGSMHLAPDLNWLGNTNGPGTRLDGDRGRTLVAPKNTYGCLGNNFLRLRFPFK